MKGAIVPWCRCQYSLCSILLTARIPFRLSKHVLRHWRVHNLCNIYIFCVLCDSVRNFHFFHSIFVCNKLVLSILYDAPWPQCGNKNVVGVVNALICQHPPSQPISCFMQMNIMPVLWLFSHDVSRKDWRLKCGLATTDMSAASALVTLLPSTNTGILYV